MGKITAKQSRFVLEYLVDLNATQAAIRAGYSAKTAEQQGYQLLQHPSVASAIGNAQEKRAVRTEITQDMVLKELAKIGFADMRKLLKWYGHASGIDVDEAEETGEVKISVANFVELFNSDDLDDDIAAAVAEVSQTKDGSLKVKLHDKQAALVNIGRHLGMFKDKVEVHASEGLLEAIAKARVRAATAKS